MGSTRATGISAAATLAAACLVLVSVSGRDKGTAKSDDPLAVPTAVSSPTRKAGQPDRDEGHRILFEVGYFIPEEGQPKPSNPRVVGYHGVFVAGQTPDVTMKNVPMRAFSPDTLAQKWYSNPFGAHEGDVVKTGIDAKMLDVTVYCNIRQDGDIVVHKVVSRHPVSGIRRGKVGCSWTVKKFG